MSTSLSIQYTVDAHDRIVSVNDDWVEFAQSNGGNALLPESIIGQAMLPQITDGSVREIYRMLLVRARAGQPVQFTYRCDSPTHRRTFEMTVERKDEERVQFTSKLLREEERPAVALLEPSCPRSNRLIRVCSWCQRVALSDGSWGVIEDAVAQERHFEANIMPRLTHCICDRCSEMMFAKLR